ncbi:MAG: type II CAAX endopeptidase family protein [Clostridiales bacterium]
MMKMIKKFPVTSFFILNFLVSWTGLYFILGVDGMLGKKTIDGSLMPGLMTAMICGPLLSSVLLIIFLEGKQGFCLLKARLTKFKVSIKWYMFALVTAPFVTILTILILTPFSSKFFPLILNSNDKVDLILGGIIGGFVAGFFEELGWTGVATPVLRGKYSILITGLLIGIVWGLWHMPLFMAPDPEGTIPIAGLIVIRLLSHLVVFRIMIVWVYDKTQSLFIAIIMHMTLTACTLIFQPSITSGVESMIYNITWTSIVAVIIMILNFSTEGEFTKR